jgi:hypothetical protein
VAGRRIDGLANFHQANVSDFLGHLGGGEDAAMRGLCTLRNLDFYHLDRVAAGPVRESAVVKASVFLAAAEITRADSAR